MGWVLRSRARGLSHILDAGICCQSCKNSSTESKYASGGASRVACCELSQLLIDLSRSKRGMKLGWVLRSRARGLANILDAGICCQSCKKSSTESKYAYAGATRVASCEPSQSLLDLSSSKRGMKLGWVVRSRARGLSHILDAGIFCQSCKKASTESKYASGGASRVACCELSQSLLDLSRSKRKLKLGWVVRSRARGLSHILDAGICCQSCKKASTESKYASGGASRVACCELSQSLLDLSRSKRKMKLGLVLRSRARGLSHILDAGICCQSCKKSSTESKYASGGASRVACCELSQSLLDLSRSKREMKLGWVLRFRARGLANILDAGICCQSCKKSSTESKYASAGATRVACFELSQSLLDLSPSKRGMKFGWVL